VRNTLIAAGPSFKHGVVSEVPAGNIDVAPTLRHTLGLPVVAADGRVLVEALAGGPDPASIEVHRESTDTTSPGREFRQRVHHSYVSVAGEDRTVAYLDYAEAEHA
jgi:hypothetical protein